MICSHFQQKPHSIATPSDGHYEQWSSSKAVLVNDIRPFLQRQAVQKSSPTSSHSETVDTRKYVNQIATFFFKKLKSWNLPTAKMEILQVANFSIFIVQSLFVSSLLASIYKSTLYYLSLISGGSSQGL